MPDRTRVRRRARRPGSCPRPPRRKRVVGLRAPRPFAEQLVLHRDLADLRLHARDLFVALVGLTALHCALAAGEKAIAPAGDGGCGDAALAAECVEILATQDAQDDLTLATR